MTTHPIITRLDTIEARLSALETAKAPKPPVSKPKAASYPRRVRKDAAELLLATFDLLQSVDSVNPTDLVELARGSAGGEVVPVKVPCSTIAALIAERAGLFVKWSTDPVLESVATSKDPRVQHHKKRMAGGA